MRKLNVEVWYIGEWQCDGVRGVYAPSLHNGREIGITYQLHLITTILGWMKK